MNPYERLQEMRRRIDPFEDNLEEVIFYLAPDAESRAGFVDTYFDIYDLDTAEGLNT